MKWMGISMSISALFPIYNNLYEKSINIVKCCVGKWPHSKANALSLIHPPPLYVKELDSN